MADLIASAKLNHLSFPSNDVPATVKFFEQQLGCTVLSQGRSAILKRPGFDIVITDASTHPVAWHDDFHFGIEMPTREAVEALYARFKAEGVEMKTEVFKHERGSRFFCVEPGGIVCEVNTRSDAEDAYRETFK